MRCYALALAVLLSAPTLALATPSINVGEYTMGEHGSIQIPIYVTGAASDLVTGINFNAQIGDGGTLLGGTTPFPGAPFFDYDGSVAQRNAILIPPGSIFAGNNTGVNDVNDDGAGGNFGKQVLWLSTTTNSGFVVANGLLAVLSISVDGAIPDGTYPLILSAGGSDGLPLNTNGATEFGGVPINIIDGHLVWVPEPSSIVLGLLAIAGLTAVTLRRRVVR